MLIVLFRVTEVVRVEIFRLFSRIWQTWKHVITFSIVICQWQSNGVGVWIILGDELCECILKILSEHALLKWLDSCALLHDSHDLAFSELGRFMFTVSQIGEGLYQVLSLVGCGEGS